MAIEIHQKVSNFCIENCPFQNLDVDTKYLYADGIPTISKVIVYCKNDHICKMWSDKMKG